MLTRICIGDDCSNVLYDLSNYYTKQEVNNLVGNLTRLEVVEELPATGENGVIYLVPKDEPGTDNIYDEYAYIDGAWESIGSTAVTVLQHVLDGAANGAIRSNTSADESQSYAMGQGAVSLGTGTKAPNAGETAVGKYNTPGYAFSVGNGSNDMTRSNAFAVTTDGEMETYFNSLAQSGVDHDLYAALTLLGWTGLVSNQSLAIKGLFNRIATFISLIGQPLSMSNNNWTSGNCTIVDSNKYIGFYVIQGGAVVWAMKEPGGNAIRGLSMSGNADSNNWNQYARTFGASVSGDVWTMQWAKQVSHVGTASYHTSGQDQAVTKVYGIIPDPAALGGLRQLTISQDIITKFLTVE